MKHFLKSILVRYQIVRFVAFLLLGIFVAWSIDNFWLNPANVRANQTTKLICSIASPFNANQLLQQGNLQYQQGQFVEALDCWQQAEKRYRAAGDRERVFISLVNQAQAQQGLGLYPRACQILLQAFGIKEQDCRQFTAEQKTALMQSLSTQPLSLAHATALRSFGDVLRTMRELDLSQSVLQLSLQQSNRLQSPEVKAANLSLGNTAYALSNRRRDLYSRSRRVEDAIATLQTAKAAFKNYQQAALLSTREKDLPTANTLQLQAQLNQLSLLITLENWLQSNRLSLQGLQEWPQLQAEIEQVAFIASQASIQLSTMQALVEQLPSHRSTLPLRINLAQHLIRLRTMAISQNFKPVLLRNSLSDLPTWSTVAQSLSATIQQAKTLQDSRSEAYALGYLGQVYQQTNQLREAFKVTQQAIERAQAVDAKEIAYQWKAQLGDIAQTQGNRAEAIVAYSDALSDLKSLRQDLMATNSDMQFSFRDGIEPIYRNLVELLLRPQEEVKPAQKNLKQAREVIEALQLAELDNFFREACLDSQRAIDEVLDQQDATAAAIYPIILRDRLEVILKLPQQNELKHYSTPISNREVEKLLDELQQNLTKPYATRLIHSLSGKLYDWLIRPAELDLTQNQVKTLVFVLDAPLRNIPLGVLYTGQRYLVEDYNLALAPSLKLVDPKPLRQQTLNVLAAGMSEFRSQDFTDLPYVVDELKTIQSIVPSQLLINQQFTTQTFKTQLNSHSFSIVHLATHGQFSSDVEKTFIVAWDKSIHVNELDTLLRTRTQNRPGAVELLILSACKTAKGDNRAVLGLAGVAVRAGARSTLASLWSINDETTALMMKQFYQELAKSPNTTKAEALRHAQLALLHDPRYQLPRFWAPYILVGNWL